MNSNSQFVCAMNRSRDRYQLPLALHEAGLLERLVTDFYAPDAPWWPLPRRLARRRTAGLPSSVTTSLTTSFLMQSAAEVLGVEMGPVFRRVDAMLGRAAGRIARKTNSHLYCYAPYLPPEDLIPSGARRAIFEYHPLPGLTWDTLREDNARYPQTNWSFALEAADQDMQAHDEWTRCDLISCASTFTKRSLVNAGCDPQRVTVVPYGFEIVSPELSQYEVLDSGTLEFLFVGQGLQRKGLHHLIEAWQRASVPDARLTRVCYRIDPGVEQMIRSKSIRLLKRQSPGDLEQLYAQSHVFIMPSLVEGFGLVYLEALARGCHVVGTYNTGLPDLHLPEFAATILDAGDIDALTSAISRLAASAGSGALDRSKIKAAALERTWQQFRSEIGDHARALLAG